MQIVRELADEGNPIAKIAFLTRLAESTVREILTQLARPGQERHRRDTPEAGRSVLIAGEAAARWETRRIAA